MAFEEGRQARHGNRGTKDGTRPTPSCTLSGFREPWSAWRWRFESVDGIRWLVSVSQKASGVRCPAVQQFAAGLPSPPPSRPIPHAGLRCCAGHRRPSSSQTDKRPRRRLTPSSPDTAKRSTPAPSSRRSRVRVRAGRPVRPACPKPLASNTRRSTSTASVFWFTGWDRLSWFWARHQPEPCADNCRPCCSELAASLFPDTPPQGLRASHNCGTKCHVPALEEGVETAETPGDGFRAGWLVAA